MKSWFLLALLASTIAFGTDEPNVTPPRPSVGTVVAEVEKLKCADLLTNTEQESLSQHVPDNYNADSQRLFEHHEHQSRNWQDFLNGTLGGDQNIHVLHQKGIKDLNEKYWDQGTTELYLEAQYDISHQFLRTNPFLGKGLPNNHKDQYVANALDEASFKTMVTDRVIERLANYMESHRPSKNARVPGFEWKSWIEANIFSGTGKTPAEAYFWMGVRHARYSRSPKNLTVEQWQDYARKFRERLVENSRNAKIDWDDLILAIHTHLGRSPTEDKALLSWLKERNATSLYYAMKIYYDILQVADFYPLPDVTPEGIQFNRYIEERAANPLSPIRTNSVLELRTLLINAKESAHLVVTDAERFGLIARSYQDRWIAAGAKIEELPSVYTQTTTALEMATFATYKRIKQIVGDDTKVHVYRTGDDLVWLLGSVTDEQFAKLGFLFADVRANGSSDPLNLKFHHSNIVNLDMSKPSADRVAEGLILARQSLMEQKIQSRQRRTSTGEVQSVPSQTKPGL